MIRRDPIGAIGSITPWNYPRNMATSKFGPALAAGNRVVLKPSELTPYTALRFAELTADLLPWGIENVVCGQGGTIGVALTQLGGKALVIIFENADVDAVVEVLHAMAFCNSGQNCTEMGPVITAAHLDRVGDAARRVQELGLRQGHVHVCRRDVHRSQARHDQALTMVAE